MDSIRCMEGLGNRVAALANGLSRASHVRFAWAVNDHVPAEWRDVFPLGIEGVDFVPDDGGLVTGWAGMSCERWDAAADRNLADRAYGRIMAAMAGRARHACAVAAAGRFYRNPAASARELAREAATAAHARRQKQVFVFADSRRDEIAAELERHGLAAVLPISPALARDLDRERDSLLEYLTDWQTLLAADTIIAVDGPSSALHPARAAGKRIIYASCTAAA